MPSGVLTRYRHHNTQIPATLHLPQRTLFIGEAPNGIVHRSQPDRTDVQRSRGPRRPCSDGGDGCRMTNEPMVPLDAGESKTAQSTTETSHDMLKQARACAITFSSKVGGLRNLEEHARESRSAVWTFQRLGCRRWDCSKPRPGETKKTERGQRNQQGQKTKRHNRRDQTSEFSVLQRACQHTSVQTSRRPLPHRSKNKLQLV